MMLALVLLAGLVALAIRYLTLWIEARRTARMLTDAVVSTLRLPRADVVVRVRPEVLHPWAFQISVRVAGKPHAAAEKLLADIFVAATKLHNLRGQP